MQPQRRVLFASYHAYPDTSNGAAHSMRTILALLAGCGWQVRVMCGPVLDATWDVNQGTLAARLHERVWGAPAGPSAHVFSFEGADGLQGTLLDTAADAAKSKATEEAFLALYLATLDEVKPDVVITYGGGPVGRAILRAAKEAGATTVFRLANFAYTFRDLFDHVDKVLVPSAFMARHYETTLQLSSHSILPPIASESLRAERTETSHSLGSVSLGIADPAPQFLTFVGPCPVKGVFWAGRVMHVLASRRPDIPLLVVTGRGSSNHLANIGLDWSRARSLYTLPPVSDPRVFYARTRVVLMPSMLEPAGRVAMEASILGIPVVASRRGGLPEMLRGEEATLEIPAEYTATSKKLPTEEEVRPWTDAIEKLWDDSSAYSEACARARVIGARCTLEVVAPKYLAFFETLANERQTTGAARFPEIPSHPAIRALEALRRGEGERVARTDDNAGPPPEPLRWP